MAEKRKKTERHHRRSERGYRSFPILYGLERPKHRAMARRLSPFGLFIATNGIVYAPGNIVTFELNVGGVLYRGTGEVRHALKVDARLARIMRPGMGIVFRDVPEALREAIGAAM